MITMRLRGARQAARRIGGSGQRAKVLLRRKLQFWQSRLITAVKTGSYFRYAHPTEDGRATGMLQSTIWGDPIKAEGGSLVARTGWGVPYGPVLEWGPESPQNRAGWWIRAKHAKTLRFRVGNKVVRAKKVFHHWSRDQLRPHFGPELDKLGPQIRQDLGDVAQEATRG